MNCEAAQRNLSLFLYGELSLEDEQAFQDHVEACAECRRAFEAEKAIHEALDAHELDAPQPLLIRCRRDLELRLAHAGAAGGAGFGARLRSFFSQSPSLLRPAGALALLALGFFAARWTAPVSPAGPTEGSAGPFAARVRYLQPEPSGKVRLVLEETRERVVTGDPQETSIRQLLLAAAREASDPGLRAESVGLLNTRPESSGVRGALIWALEHDPNAGVRLKAIEALKPYAAAPDVRSALSQALLGDDNPGIRTQAIDLLVEHKDDSMVGAFQESMQREDNQYVRERCRRALEEMNASVGTF
jgi:hypothetical protein